MATDKTRRLGPQGTWCEWIVSTTILGGWISEGLADCRWGWKDHELEKFHVNEAKTLLWLTYSKRKRAVFCMNMRRDNREISQYSRELFQHSTETSVRLEDILYSNSLGVRSRDSRPYIDESVFFFKLRIPSDVVEVTAWCRAEQRSLPSPAWTKWSLCRLEMICEWTPFCKWLTPRM